MKDVYTMTRATILDAEIDSCNDLIVEEYHSGSFKDDWIAFSIEKNDNKMVYLFSILRTDFDKLCKVMQDMKDGIENS